MASEETLYCLCRRAYEDDQFMIECDICRDWFHGSCVGIKERQASEIEIYHCPNCQISHGPLVLKKRRTLHRRNYSESDDNFTKTAQAGSTGFIQELKNRPFVSGEEVPIIRLPGYELTKERLEEQGFDVPILVERKDGLDLRVPPSTFSIQDVENHVGSMREIDVIDVAKQEDVSMLMREWTEYYNSPNRPKIYNVISLEFSNTKLAEIVEPPRVVRELSWVSQYWPTDQPSEDQMFQKPEVQRYCLMGVKDSFTDFHADFGGTSVWYHVLKGEKVFYLVRPTPANLALYERWVTSSNQGEMFFGDQVDICYKCVVKQSQTLFIPTGWIHAVLTPIDSLVFGGNFLHNLNIDLQIQVYEIEKRVKTPERFMFPNYETLHWYAAKYIVDKIKDYNEDKKRPPNYLIQGAKAISVALREWTQKKDLNSRYIYIKRDTIPETIQYGKLLKELNKEVKISERSKPEEKKKRKKRANTDPELPPEGPKAKAKKVSHGKGGLVFDDPLVELKDEQEDMKPLDIDTDSVSAGNLKVRIPKPGAFGDASVYDFSDEPEEESPVKLGDSPRLLGSDSPRLSGSSPRLGSPRGPMSSPRGCMRGGVKFKQESPKMLSPRMDRLSTSDTSSLGSPDCLRSPMSSPGLPSKYDVGKKASQHTASSTSGLKLKLTASKVIGGGGDNQFNQFGPGHFHPLSPSRGPQVKLEMSPAPHSHPDLYTSHHRPPETSSGESKEEDNVVVDDSPQKYMSPMSKKIENLSGTTIKPGSLKMKLSVNKFPENPADTSQDSSFFTSQSDSELETAESERDQDATDQDATDPFVDPVARMNMPTIQGGLNGSISDILEASGYGTETDFKIDDDIKSSRASPTMRDAIQGMLSMSRMGGLQLSTLVTSAHSADRARAVARPRRATYEEDGGERMPTCYKDSEFVYPTLDTSDAEGDNVFKPRGRPKKDETWNPKAKLNPNCPKPDRPQREGTRRESVESGLAAAAAKLANLPPPKRQYIRRKPKSERKQIPAVLDLDLPSTSGLGLPLDIVDSSMSMGSTPKQDPTSPKGGKKHKKGMATAKQRLGKILKIHKMMM